MKVAVVGVTGYGGKILWQLLQQHPNVTAVTVYTRQADLTALQNQLAWSAIKPFTVANFDVDELMANNNMAFFATSAGVTKDLALTFMQARFPVIDLSGDLRLQDGAQYQQWYQTDTAAPAEALAQTSYGLAEFNQATGAYIANPGCYATATLLGLAPLVQGDLVDLDSIIVDAKSGVSGAGKKLSDSTHYANVDENFSLYKVNAHQHIPEIMQQLQVWQPQMPPFQFTTGLLPLNRGLMATIYAKVAPADVFEFEEKLALTLEKLYADQPFVKVTGQQLPDLKAVVGSNLTAIGWQFNPQTRTVMVVSVIDNLVKGAAGQAIQNFNQLFGFAQTAGLGQLPFDI
ncbi:MAG TPA: N-acetyl-gamma-glutamyl-phosphate reductase [Lactobacillaceae bacterium]|jgi:N-acetyl-gamma-glutamyl-phosphate reductase